MPKKYQVLLFVLIVAVVIAAPLIWVNSKYTSCLIFNPAEFINKYPDFFTGLSLLFASFFLINVYWDKRLKDRQLSQSVTILRRFFQQLESLAQQGIGMLSKQYSQTQIDESKQRDQEVRRIITRMAVLKENMQTHFPGETSEFNDQLVRTMVDLYWMEIVPIIDELNHPMEIRGRCDQILSQMKELEKKAEEALVYLDPVSKGWVR